MPHGLVLPLVTIVDSSALARLRTVAASFASLCYVVTFGAGLGGKAIVGILSAKRILFRINRTIERGDMSIYTLRMPKVKSPGANSHVFEAKPGAGKGCICLPKSLCQQATTADTVGVEGFMCLSRDRMWGKTLSYGGDVCAACLAALSRYAENGAK